MEERTSTLNTNKTKTRQSTNIALLLIGRAISMFGTEIYNFTLGLYVLKVTGSALSFAITLVFGVLPRIILGPIAGVLADRVDRKKMVVTMDILSGLIVLAFFFYLNIRSFELHAVYLTALLLNTANLFFDISFSASIPNIVDDSRLLKVYSLNESITSAATIAGPFIGGMLFAFINIKIFILINALSFIMSSIMEMFINFNYNKSDKNLDKKITSIFMDMREGVKYLYSQKLVLNLYIFALLINFLFTLGLTVPFPYIINHHLKMSAGQFGFLEAMMPLGILIGSISLSVLPEREKKYKTVISGMLTESLAMIFIGVSIIPLFSPFTKMGYLILYTILMLLLGSAVSIVNVSIRVTLQRIIPDNIRGRVLGLIATVAMAITPLSLALSGIIVDKVPPFILPLFVGCGLICITIAMALNKNIKSL